MLRHALYWESSSINIDMVGRIEKNTSWKEALLTPFDGILKTSCFFPQVSDN